MRYYCESCEFEFYYSQGTILGSTRCPMCEHDMEMQLIPEWETPKQYEKRTGKKWNGAVWYRYKYVDDGVNGGIDWSRWYPKTAEEASFFPYDSIYKKTEVQCICANSPEPPPDDYMPEVEA